MFGDEQASLGALDESGEDAEVSRPWEFDLDSVQPGQPGPGASTVDPITEPVRSSARPMPTRCRPTGWCRTWPPLKWGNRPRSIP